MARNTKAAKAAQAPVAQAPATTVATPVVQAPALLALPAPVLAASPLAALAGLTVPVQQPVATPATIVAVPAGHAGVAWGNLTKSQQAIATAKGGVHLAPALSKAPALVLGQTAYKVRSGNNAFWWACCMAAMQGNSGRATAQQMVAAGACPKFVGYAVTRGWLASLPA